MKRQLKNHFVLFCLCITLLQCGDVSRFQEIVQNSDEGTVGLTSISPETETETTAPSVEATTPVPEAAINPEDYFLSANDVFTFTVGERASYGSIENTYSLPDGSRGNVLSFGNGGELTIELNDYIIVDGDGPDFIIFENPFTGWTERAQVAVSEDGVTYTIFSCDAFDAEGIYAGCAGVTEINYSSNPDDMRDPTLSGGDVFDLADVGITQARFIRITDMNTCYPDFICTTTAGFDFDGLAIANGVNE